MRKLPAEELAEEIVPEGKGNSGWVKVMVFSEYTLTTAGLTWLATMANAWPNCSAGATTLGSIGPGFERGGIGTEFGRGKRNQPGNREQGQNQHQID